ncbi:ADP-ribose pyrophosphatase [Cryptococcus neoformans Gb118]|nr:ADP-ribose pyrophosphatase [Cryptococcus neoformans var. grubii MW-RSA36]OXL09846.1 ADP-ribose pyrophosphatase [Cryptococcus neoformans var. grubii Gb118]
MRFCLHQTSRTIKTTLLSQPRAFISHSIIIAQLSRTMVSESKSSQKPENLKTEEYKTDAKWLKLEKINWKDQDGKQRVWEVANRANRPKSGVDSVHILALLFHPHKPVSTVIIEQYRPPVASTVIELPAGLIDEGEDPATAALRELHEETGYGSGKSGQGNATVSHVSHVLAKDPGMSGANMHLVIIDVKLGEHDPDPEQHLDQGEHIAKKIIPLKYLSRHLDDYARRGFMVDTILASLAQGWELAHHFDE